MARGSRPYIQLPTVEVLAIVVFSALLLKLSLVDGLTAGNNTASTRLN
jgi:hypothetical protein